MKEDDSMRQTQLEKARAILLERRGRMLDEIREQLTRSGDHDTLGLVNHLEETDDWAVADQLAETDIGMLRRDVDELRELEAALERVRDGTYGTCVDCGEAIAAARLAAAPEARRCIDCQAAHEHRTAGGGHSSL
jgi:RNA polymerase-binding protein DksA